MKKTLTILSIIAVMVALFIVAFPKNNPVKKLFTKKDPGNSNPGDIITNPQERGTTGPILNNPDGFPLKEGSRGSYVMQLQAALNKYFGASLKVDGIFGPKTAQAVTIAKFDPTNITYTVFKDILNG